MIPEQWEEIKEKLDAALDLAPGERSAYLDKVASGNPELRHELESLIAAHERAGVDFLRPSSLSHLTLKTGTRLGDYEVLTLLGSGGMGEVYRARDLRLRRDVAIKVLPALVSSDPERLRRFEQEAQAAAALNHPNILAVYQMGTYEGVPYLVSELLEGETLREHMRSDAIPVRKAIDYAVQVAHGLAAAHEKGILHRDVKPENLFVTSGGRVKILDFGLAKLTQPAKTSSSAATLDVNTEPGVVMGTEGYMSPEQVRGQTADHRADIFAFGAILYEMLAGKRAFQGQSSADTMSAILKEDPPGISQVVRNVPPALQRIVHRCLEKNSEERFQSASDLAFALKALTDAPAPYRSLAAKLSEALGGSSDTETGGAKRRVGMRWNVAVPAAVVIVALAGGSYFYLPRPSHLTDKDTIVLADFTNTTRDPVFDDTLKTALEVSLRQSPFLNVLPDNKVTQTLQLMARPAGTKVSPDVARELCQRAGSKAYLAGSIASLGSDYVLGLKAVNCHSGDTLAQELATATAKEKVLDTLGATASKLRGKLGESLATVQRFNVPLAEATTTSLDALKAYSAGARVLHEQGDLAAIPFFKRAIELDPDFAMAYATLGNVYGNVSNPDLGDDYNRKAFDLRGRTSERERFSISGSYYVTGAAQLDKATETAELWANTYTNEAAPHFFLASVYQWLGQFDKALAHETTALEKEPNNLNGLALLVEAHTALNRLSEAETAADKMRRLAPDVPQYSIYFLGFVRGDENEMAQQLALAKAGKGDVEVLMSAAADTAAYHGRIEKPPVVATSNDNEAAAISQAKIALWEAEFQLRAAASRDARAALAKAPTLYVRVLATLALARAGDNALAEKVSSQVEKASPPDTMMRLYADSSIRAALELDRNNPARALNELQPAAKVEMSSEFLYPGATMYPVYLRGMAYLALHQAHEASAEFQKFIDHRGVIVNCPLGALAHLQLARAYTMAGDTAKAKTAYEDFLALWKDADPDIPILKQAQAEYSKLQ
jgi:serine/threonine protein kinase/tetratricopeptide (TPR) repeat protein